jgi:hypothetical protein
MLSPVEQFPSLASVVGASWWQANPDWFSALDMPRPVWYQQCDGDLGLLARRIHVTGLISCYRAMLRDRVGFIPALYEVHAAALLGSSADRLALHVPRGDGGGRNFDIAATIVGHDVNADVKTRDDRFPFNLPRVEEPDGIRGFAGSRASLDPWDAAEAGMPRQEPLPSERNWKGMPESSVVVEVLAEALRQLPEAGISVVVLGQIQGDRDHLERALYGVEVCDFVTERRTKDSWSEWRRLPNGIFGHGPKAEAFTRLSAVLWIRLMQGWNDDEIYPTYQLYENPSAQCPLSAGVRPALEATMKEWTALPAQ